jgi:hypothetical protein
VAAFSGRRQWELEIDDDDDDCEEGVGGGRSYCNA